MKKIILILSLIAVGCNSSHKDIDTATISCDSIGFYNYPTLLPKDFGIKFDIFYQDKYSYNSFDSTLTKEYDWGKYFKTKLGLTFKEKEIIYSSMKRINILSYPHICNKECSDNHMTSYKFEFTFDGIKKEIIWSGVSQKNKRIKKLENLFILCDSIIRHNEVYIQTTPADLRVYE